MKNKLDELRFEFCVWLMKPYFPYLDIYIKKDKVIGITFTNSKKYNKELSKIK